MRAGEEGGSRLNKVIRWHHQFNDMSLRKLWEIEKDREAWPTSVHGAQRVRHDLVVEQQ